MRIRPSVLVAGAVLLAGPVVGVAPAFATTSPSPGASAASPSPSTSPSVTPTTSTTTSTTSPAPTTAPPSPVAPTSPAPSTSPTVTPAPSTSPAVVAGGSTITGTVTNASGGAIAGAAVRVYDLAGAPDAYDENLGDPSVPFGTAVGTATTSSAGTYSVASLTGGPLHRYVVCVDPSGVAGAPATGYTARCLDVPVTVAPGATFTGASLALGTGAAVTGTVTHQTGSTSSPLAGIPVQGEDSGFSLAPVTSSSSGSFTVSSLSAYGDQQVCADGTATTATTDGLERACSYVSARAGTTGTTTIALRVAGAVTGVVTGAHGAALAGVAVTVDRHTVATTDSSGRYTLRGVAPGTQEVCVFGAPVGYLDRCSSSSQSTGNGPSATVAAGATTTVATVALTQAGRVQGTVTDGHGNPVVGADVYVTSASTNYGAGTTTTAYDGSFDIGEPSGSFQLCTGTEHAVGASTGGYVAGACTTATATSGTTTGGVALTTAVGGAITGKVTDTGNRPIDGADVQVQSTAANGPSGYASTAADGTYTVPGLPAGSYTVCFSAQPALNSANGWLDQCWNATDSAHATVVAVSTGARTTGINAKLKVSGAISGVVTSTGNVPLAGVDVEVSASTCSGAGGQCVEYGYTAADGSYLVTGLAAGSYTVCFQGYQVTSGSSTTGYAPACAASPVSVTPPAVHSGVNAKLVVAGAIAGTVTGTNRVAIPGVDVSVQQPSAGFYVDATTGSDGKYSVLGLTAGSYQVCFHAANATGSSSTGYVDQCYDGVAVDGTPTPVAVSLRKTTTVNAALKAGGAISGSVTGGGSPLQGVTVSVSDTSGNQVTGLSTDASGSFTVTGLAAGKYEVCFDATYVVGGTPGGYVGQCWKNKAATGTPTAITVTTGKTTTGITAALAPGGAVAGTVTDATGAPLDDVDVEVDGPGGSVVFGFTGSDGTWTVPGLKAGTYTVCFEPNYAQGGSSTTGWVTACWKNRTDGTKTSIHVTTGTVLSGISASLATGGAISGTVTDTNGAPIGDVEVYAYPPAGGNGTSSTTTAADGTYTVVGLPTETADVCFDPSGVTAPSSTGYVGQCWKNKPVSGTDQTPVSVTAGQTTTGISAQLAGGGEVTGGVVDATNGDPLGDVNISGSQADGTSFFATTASDGTFSATGVAPGSYVVCFDASNATGGTQGTGYAGDCYDGRPIGSTTANVTVTAGHSIALNNQALQVGALVKGTTYATNGVATSDASVAVDDSSFNTLSSANEGSDGTYTALGVRAGSVQVCAYFEDTGDSVCVPTSVTAGGTFTVDVHDSATAADRAAKAHHQS